MSINIMKSMCLEVHESLQKFQKPLFHGGDTGSNPVGDANNPKFTFNISSLAYYKSCNPLINPLNAPGFPNCSSFACR